MGSETDAVHRVEGLAGPPAAPTGKPRWRRYQVTTMRNGLFRAECYQPDCGWYFDAVTEQGAENEVSSHASYHGSRYKRGRNKSHVSGESDGSEGARQDHG